MKVRMWWEGSYESTPQFYEAKEGIDIPRWFCWWLRFMEYLNRWTSDVAFEYKCRSEHGNT